MQTEKKTILTLHEAYYITDVSYYPQCWIDVGPPSTTMAQPRADFDPAYCVCWEPVRFQVVRTHGEHTNVKI